MTAIKSSCLYEARHEKTKRIQVKQANIDESDQPAYLCAATEDARTNSNHVWSYLLKASFMLYVL